MMAAGTHVFAELVIVRVLDLQTTREGPSQDSDRIQ